jgi:uracil-DNA glycosylase
VRTILVGEAPPQWRGEDTPDSLPFSGPSGKRFSDMLGVDVTEAFETRNLLSKWPGKAAKGSKFPLELARTGAQDLVQELEQREYRPRLLLCGTRVANAFRMKDFPQLEWHIRTLYAPMGVTFFIALVPHPSGVNRTWNDPVKADAVRKFLVAEYERSQRG